MSVLVFCDAYRGSLSKAAAEAVSYGKQIASAIGGEVNVVTYGNVDAGELAGLGAYGASNVGVARSITDTDSQQLTRLVVQAAQQHSAKVVVCSHDFTGKMVAPRVAAALKAGIVSGAVAVPDTSSGFAVRKAVFSGKAFATFNINTDIKVVSLLPNSISPTKGQGTANVSEVSVDTGAAGVTVKEFRPEGGDGVPLT